MANGKRTCGECRLCCKILNIDSLAKPAGVWCPNACDVGCARYDSRPKECAEFECLWLSAVDDQIFTEAARPDRLRVMFFKSGEGGVDAIIAYESHQGASLGARAQKVIRALIAEGHMVAITFLKPGTTGKYMAVPISK